VIDWLDAFRQPIFHFLGGLAAAQALLLTYLVLQRSAEDLYYARRRRLISRYQPLVDQLLGPTPPTDAAAILSSTRPRHHAVVADLLLNALRVATGDIVDRLREVVQALGLVDRWRGTLDDRRWWRRSEAARALGLLREPSARDRLTAALDDPHEEVRAAAVDALGRIGDPQSIPALLTRLSDESRHQRTRVVEAIRQQGVSAVPFVIEHARTAPADATLMIGLLAMIGDGGSVEPLIAWSNADDPATRAAVQRALGSIGLDDRSFYFALRGLDDEDANVRGMAARALGRSGRAAAARYLAEHLNDDWLVAAHCAAGLRRLGPQGHAELQARAEASDQAGDLARQMLWERDFLRPGA
jgi:HEAT repeat protein